MRVLSYIKVVIVFVLALLCVEACRSVVNDVSPTVKKSTQSNRSARVDVIGPYTVTYNGVTNDGATWTYTIQRTGIAQANGLSHWIVNLGTCVLYSNVLSATVDGQPYTDLANSEGGGTGCSPTGQFLKFDNLPDRISDGQPHTFSFTLNVVVDEATVATYVKAGSACYSGETTGPGCYHICGNVLNEAVITTTTNSTTACRTDPTSFTVGFTTSTSSSTAAGAGIVVTLMSGATSLTTVTTDAAGNYCLNNLPAGTYTVAIPTISPTGSETITVNPGQSQSFTLPPSTNAGSFTITTASSTTVNGATVLVDCVVPQGCSFSQGYWFAKPGLIWPGSVTVGGKTYSQDEGRAIWNTSNAGGIAAAKKVFLQVATIKLSGSNVLPTATVLADVAKAEAWLANLPKLTPTNLKTISANADALAAADRISAWIELNHCE
jgi:hypothetical protein